MKITDLDKAPIFYDIFDPVFDEEIKKSLLEDSQEQEVDELTHNLTEEDLLEDYKEKENKVPREIKLSEKEAEELLDPIFRSGTLTWLRTNTSPPKVFRRNEAEIWHHEDVEERF